MKKIDGIIFDVDSTLVTFEGLDWLSQHKNKQIQVRQLTQQSMNGELDFNTAMIQKMALISPSYEELIKLGQAYCRNLVLGISEVITQLHFLQKEVWILTGNFQPAVGILAQQLEIDQSRVICNRVFFGKGGEYLGFDQNHALSHNGGKGVMIDQINPDRSKELVFVGDVMTDLEVKDKVSLFVGFGGVVERKIVKQNADVFINDYVSLLPLILSQDELGLLAYNS